MSESWESHADGQGPPKPSKFKFNVNAEWKPPGAVGLSELSAWRFLCAVAPGNLQRHPPARFAILSLNTASG